MAGRKFSRVTNHPSFPRTEGVLGGRTNGFITRQSQANWDQLCHLNIRSNLYTSMFFSKILATTDSGKCVHFDKQDPLRFELWSQYFLVLWAWENYCILWAVGRSLAKGEEMIDLIDLEGLVFPVPPHWFLPPYSPLLNPHPIWFWFISWLLFLFCVTRSFLPYKSTPKPSCK